MITAKKIEAAIEADYRLLSKQYPDYAVFRNLHNRALKYLIEFYGDFYENPHDFMFEAVYKEVSERGFKNLLDMFDAAIEEVTSSRHKY